MKYPRINLLITEYLNLRHFDLGVIKRASNWVLLVTVVLVQGCAEIPKRDAIPLDLINDAQIPNIPHARFWGDEPPDYTEEWFAMSDTEMRERHSSVYGKQHHFLALSGGGAKGAFGAGLLVGWSESGTRPEFHMVTGISTGALIAPFAFMGSEYDDQLKEVYTQYTTKDMLIMRDRINGLLSDAMTDSSPLRALIAKYIDDDMVQAIAEENRKGRDLLIGTTNLDARRPVIWEIGRIAASGAPNAKALIHDIMLASASIPVAFPPVMIQVEANGQRYDEMHVDGGMTSQVFLYPLGIDWRRVGEKLATKSTPQVYTIRNAWLKPKSKSIKRGVGPIAGASISSLTRTQGIGDMYKIYVASQRDGLDYRLAYIPDDFHVESKEPFDRDFMNKLFELGYSMAKQGYPWKRVPPGYVE